MSNIGTPPVSATSTKWWDGTQWRSEPFQYRVPYSYTGRWNTAQPVVSASMRWNCGTDESWGAGGMFASDNPLVYSSGTVYQDSKGFLGDAIVYLRPYNMPNDLRAKVSLLKGMTLTQRARVQLVRVSAGTSPQTAKFTWQPWQTSDPEFIWQESTVYSASSGYFTPSRTFTVPDSYGGYLWAPYFIIEQGLLGGTAVWRMQVDWVELLMGGVVATAWEGGGFAVRHNDQWLTV